MVSPQQLPTSPSYDQCVFTKQTLPASVESIVVMAYRSIGLGLYGACLRFAGMPLEKIALYMNSAQVSGSHQLRQAMRLTFTEGITQSTIPTVTKNPQVTLACSQSLSMLTPYRVVGPASLLAWFLQYSVMGMVFQVCDSALSASLHVPRMPYGDQLMEDASNDADNHFDALSTTKLCTKIILAPIMAGTIESIVANRAEVQRYYGIQRLTQVESSLSYNRIRKLCGPAFLANASRNGIMSATSFVVTPTLYRNFYPQDHKTKVSLFWFGLGLNIFGGNVVAISQQALWGRALDYVIPSDSCHSTVTHTRNIQYKVVIQEGFLKGGISSFFTVPKWATRVLMNAPVQGTLPWFYNEVLPLAENQVLGTIERVYLDLVRRISEDL